MIIQDRVPDPEQYGNNCRFFLFGGTEKPMKRYAVAL
jgi:hypothetical protein